MGFDVDASGYTSETDGQSDRPSPGQYHVLIVKWDDSFEKTDAIICEMKVLAGTTPGQEGKTHTEFFSTGSKDDDPQKREKGTAFCMKRIATAAMAAGAIKPGERKAIEPGDMLARDLVIKLEEDTYKGKTRVRIPFCDMWPTWHDAVADVPKGDTPEGGDADIPFDDAVSDL